MRKYHRKCHADGGNIPSEGLALGKAQATRSGESSKAISMGQPAGKNLAGGGRASGLERLAEARKRNEILGGTHSDSGDEFAKGGAVYKRMKSLYKALHGHFENAPQMKKLHARRADVYEGEPHRESKKEMQKASGGRLWIKGAIKNPGALHKSLHIPNNKKIPMKTLEKAEHSKSPLTRKRAYLASTLRKFHSK